MPERMAAAKTELRALAAFCDNILYIANLTCTCLARRLRDLA
jgi:hypothetical protein